MNYYPHHIGDYLKDTAHLSMVEDGAYRRLLDLYYLHEQPLPAEKRQVYRLARASAKPEQKSIDIILDEYFELTDAGWTHKRCDAEIGKSREKSDKARTSAARRWQSESNANASADAMRTHTETHTEGNAYPITNNQEPITKSQKERTKTSRAARKTPLPVGFTLSDSVRSWAAEHGHTRLQERFDHFVGSAAAKGYTYVDWDQALRNAIRDDWAKLNQPQRGMAPRVDARQAENDRRQAEFLAHDGGIFDDGRTLEMER